MAKIKVRVKTGAKGKPLGERVAQLRTEQGRNQKGEKVLYKPKAKLNVHIHDGR
jgi:hypothetical protein